MVWDDDLLRGLSQSVRDTFGEDTWEDAVKRALVAMTKAAPDGVDTPFAADAVCQGALRLEFLRLLQPH